MLPTKLWSKRQGNKTVRKQGCGLWTQSADSSGCKSRQPKQNICQAVKPVCGTVPFNRCLCATKDTAEVSRVSNGKWNPCRRPNEVGAVNSYSIRHCAVRTWVTDACHVAGMRRIISAVLTFIAATKYDTLFDMLYDERFDMIYDKSRVAVIWPNNWSAISGTARFDMTKWLSFRNNWWLSFRKRRRFYWRIK